MLPCEMHAASPRNSQGPVQHARHTAVLHPQDMHLPSCYKKQYVTQQLHGMLQVKALHRAMTRRTPAGCCSSWMLAASHSATAGSGASPLSMGLVNSGTARLSRQPSSARARIGTQRLELSFGKRRQQVQDLFVQLAH